MAWSAQQEQAIKAVKKWLADPHGPQIFRLFGSAGVGKTTLAVHLAADVPGLVLFGCYTGKASLVMRKKGCYNAMTLHSMIYRPQQDELTGKLHFSWNGDSDACWASLIVVDEVSQVDEKMATDLLRFGRKVSVLGDPAQLPPVGGAGYFINAEPDFMLTEVHRQAADNPIIRMCTDVREGRGLQLGTYGESKVLLRGDVDRETMQRYVLSADQVLCGMNRTRASLNARIRQLKGIAGDPVDWLPAPGERLVCLRNNREKNLFNGSMRETQRVQTFDKYVEMRVKSLDEEGMSPVDVATLRCFFDGTDKDVDWRVKMGWDEFTYGWALSVHKSQGSAWDDVLVYDESTVFREDANKWLYTAISRAAEKVTVLR